MLEFVLELVLQALAEALVEGLVEFLVAVGWESLGHAFRSSRKSDPLSAVLGWGIVGAACGGVSVLILPKPLLPPSRLPGVSLVVSPLVTGGLMKLVGDRRRRAGTERTMLATFWGGAVFAFLFSAVRFVLMRLR